MRMRLTFWTVVTSEPMRNSMVFTPSRTSDSGTGTPSARHIHELGCGENGFALSCHGPPFTRKLGTCPLCHQLNVTSAPVGCCWRYTGTVCTARGVEVTS